MNNMENSVKNVLHMESITMQFGGVVAVNGLTLDVNEHEIVALIGPNGAGKTTAFNCVTGIYSPPLVPYPLTVRSYWPIRPRAKCGASMRAI